MCQTAFITFFVGCILFNNFINGTNKANDGQNKINDLILEFFHNCSCVPFYQCSAVNNYMFLSKANFKSDDFGVIMCSNYDFVCCKKVTINETETNDKKFHNTNEEVIEPSFRNPSFNVPACGIAKTQIDVRILNSDDDSVDAISGEFPWIVEIFYKRNDLQNPYKFACGGSLIHPKVVLTATHCIISKVRIPQTLKIIATGQEVFQSPGIKPENERNVVKIIKHSDYYSISLYNDIALLILDKEYNFTNTILNTICLSNSTQNFDNRRCISVGWGSNPRNNKALRKVDLPVVNFKHCQNLLRKTKLGSFFNLHSSFMCAGGEEGKDTCNGDGGGPLMCLGENQFVQVGIVSWGVSQKCGVAAVPGVYTNVGKFTNWIKDELSQNNIKLI